jgi:hypothetical protein
MKSKSGWCGLGVWPCAAVIFGGGNGVLGATAVGAATGDAPAGQISLLQRQLTQLQGQLQQLAEENRALREHQAEIDREVSAWQRERGAAPAALSPGAAAPSLPAAAATSSAGAPDPQNPRAGAPGDGLRLWGYGEVYYSDPTHESRSAQADLARAVFGIGYAFDERTEFNSEYELEHAVASASDVGEFEVEQFYVDRRLGDSWGLRAGLLLMPFGLLNEHHEPTRFYGVQRNFIETLIIPSTWREGGLGLHGDTPGGWGLSAGLTTGFDLAKWDFTPQFPLYTTALELGGSDAAALRAGHQELALANARHLSQYAALSYYGRPGLLVGGAVSTGEAPLPGATAPTARVTLWEAHARWTQGPLDLSALYARGAIGGLAPVNAAHPGAPNPIPSSFYGGLLQAAWTPWERGEYRATPFVRFEDYQLGASYAGSAGPALPTGLVPISAQGDLGYWPQAHDRVWTAGANLYLGTHLVVKGDYQWFELNQALRRFDLGLGISF